MIINWNLKNKGFNVHLQGQIWIVAEFLLLNAKNKFLLMNIQE